MRVAIVGSRKHENLEEVRSFVVALAAKHPDTIVISGGATGVDSAAEQAARTLGLPVISFRPTGADERFYIQRWQLGSESSITNLTEPTFADYRSAALYRDMLIANACDRLVAFHWKLSAGTAFTVSLARDYGKPVHVYDETRGYARTSN